MHSYSSQTDPAEDNCLKQQLFLLGQTELQRIYF